MGTRSLLASTVSRLTWRLARMAGRRRADRAGTTYLLESIGTRRAALAARAWRSRPDRGDRQPVTVPGTRRLLHPGAVGTALTSSPVCAGPCPRKADTAGPRARLPPPVLVIGDGGGSVAVRPVFRGVRGR